METSSTKPLAAHVVLGVAAHPDDLDFMAAGTMAAFAQAGAEVYYLVLTDGSKGTADTGVSPKELTERRQEEQRQAAQALGVKDVFFGPYEDGALEVTMELKKDIVRGIRQLKPDVVVAFDPSMLYDAGRNFVNHPDHRAAGQAALDAVYPLARDHLAFPDLYEEGLKPHKVRTLLLTNFAAQNYYVDITDTIDDKLRALAAHVSQKADVESTQAMMRHYAELDGKTAGCRYAEAFVRIDID